MTGRIDNHHWTLVEGVPALAFDLDGVAYHIALGTQKRSQVDAGTLYATAKRGQGVSPEALVVVLRERTDLAARYRILNDAVRAGTFRATYQRRLSSPR